MAALLQPSGVPDPIEAPPLRWGILAPGGIASTFATAVARDTRSSVVAVGSRDGDRATAFAALHEVSTAYGSYADLVADDSVDAVYVASPHSEHRAHALLALNAGKPVLVEKAFTRNLREADEVLACGRAAGLLVAEAMWSRYLPHYDVVRRTVDSGVLGDLVLVEADHGQRLWPDGPPRLADPALAGGSLLDLGVYPLSFLDMVLGPLQDVNVDGTLTDQGVDATVQLTARTSGSVLARAWSTMAATTPCTARIVGTEGRLELAGRFYAPTTVRLVASDGRVLEEMSPDHTGPSHGFAYQAAEFARTLRAGAVEAPSMPHEATRRVISLMDNARARLSVVYPGE
ncbi:MAG: Gfo/Idh/MocA family oxidoreductase [Dermatophilaceae bacterium]